MARRKSSDTVEFLRANSPGGTPEERENQLIALAYDAVERRIRNGEATSAELVHFLKAGSIKQQQEMDKLQKENELLRARTEAIESEKNRDELYRQAIEAMRAYAPPAEDELDDPYLY